MAAWAGTRSDGLSCLSWPSNVSSTPIEVSEHIAPLRFHHKRLRPDSGGPGRHRGGLGQEILLESRSVTPIAVSFLAERTRFPAFGIEGGQAGAPGELRINGEQVDPNPNTCCAMATRCNCPRREAEGTAIPPNAIRPSMRRISRQAM